MATRAQPKLLAQGKPRMLGGSARGWRVRLYAPSAGSNNYQVFFRAPAGDGEPWKRVLRRAASEEEARKIFDQAERALDTEQGLPVGADVRASRTIRMLGEEYLDDSRKRGKQPRTMEGRQSRLNAHIVPTIGDVPVAKWRIQHSRAVMEKGSATLHSQRGREDLRGQMAAMRKLAWRMGWLDRSIDPLDGLDIGRSTVLQGATTHYVDPRLRPETRQVRAMAAAADKLCGPGGTDPLMTRLPLLGTKIRVAGFGGLRLGEQNGLRAIDVFFDRGYVLVNGSWVTPRHAPGFRGPVKNQVLHEVPLPRSLMRDELLPRAKELLGLPARASLQQVLNAQEEERQRRAQLATRSKDTSLAWWNYPVPPEEEQWLFVDNVTGLPVKPEMHNERWHRVRAWVEENDPDNAWPKTIVYRNLRHHAATKWFHDELGEPWEVVAQYLGDKLTTVLNHYVRAGEDALRDSVNKLSTR
ncbi:tyrosine-type recombinase/integrase [Nocardioides sp. Iso805N]|uniref:tyrosine-type recombinase/integrase n=1 Tax=Nocardioides sp. Iso805N TaxID=1283287 RepID=UPI0003715719|nr:tyrosine-type recombinase/integrase [Nocardioides sp. Iso805N]